MVAVLFFHGGHFRGGYLGVDLFFVLSGFLITSLLLAEGTSDKQINLGNFWVRRARRLLPALGVMLLGIAVYARFAADPTQLHRIRMDGLATIFYVANWRAVLSHADYWSLFSAPSPMEHTWSLAIEEQFYVVWPLVFVALVALVKRRRGDVTAQSLANAVLCTALVAGAASAIAALAFYAADGSNRVYFGTDTRAFAILAGVAVAALNTRFGPVRSGVQRNLLEAVGVVGAAILAICWTILDGSSPALYRGGLLLCSAAGALVIAAAAHPNRGVIARVAEFAPLRWFGLISYGVYLYHWPLFVWLDAERVNLTGWPLFAVRIAATLVVAVISYRFVEQPIRHSRGWRRRTGFLVPTAGFAAVSVAILAATIGYRPPPKSTFQSAELDTAVQTADRTDGPRLMIVGNSVAWFLADEGFAHLKTSPQLTSYNAASIGCTYPDTDMIRSPNGRESNMFTAKCDMHWDEVVDRFRPDVVLFVRNDVTNNEFRRNGVYLKPCSAGYREWLTQSLEHDGARFTRYGATFVLVSSTYSGPNLAQTDRPADIRAATCVNDIYRDVAAAHPSTMRFVDLNHHLCTPDGECKKELDGVLLRKDGTHFKGEGAKLIAGWLVEQIGLAKVKADTSG